MAVGFVLVTSFGVRLICSQSVPVPSQFCPQDCVRLVPQSLEEMQELCGRVGLAGGLQKDHSDGVPCGLLPVVTLLVYISPGGFLLSGGRRRGA